MEFRVSFQIIVCMIELYPSCEDCFHPSEHCFIVWLPCRDRDFEPAALLFGQRLGRLWPEVSRNALQTTISQHVIGRSKDTQGTLSYSDDASGLYDLCCTAAMVEIFRRARQIANDHTASV